MASTKIKTVEVPLSFNTPKPSTMRMHHEVDPSKVILEKIGDISEIELFANQVLLGVYERPEKTASGLYLSDQSRKEDEHQGKAALVLKLGPSAFVSDSNYDFHGQSVKPGDWISISVADGRKLRINGQLCRMVEDQYIRMKIPRPDIVY